MRTSLKALGLVSALIMAPIASSPLYADESNDSHGSMRAG